MAVRKKSSTYSRNEQCVTNCDLTYAVQKIGGRWKLQILSKLQERKYRFTELKHEFSFITERMLALQLRAMEEDGLIKRTVFAEVPPRVEYQLDEMGISLLPILEQLSMWGNGLKQKIEESSKHSIARDQ